MEDYTTISTSGPTAVENKCVPYDKIIAVVFFITAVGGLIYLVYKIHTIKN